MVATILVSSAVTGALGRPIAPWVLERWGFGIPDLDTVRAFQVFITPFQILRPYMVATIGLTLLLFLGACEVRLGTVRAFAVFWVCHLAGYFGGAGAVLLLAHFGFPWAQTLTAVRDVGASNGAMGAAGVVVILFPDRARRMGLALMLGYLLLALVLDAKFWDLEHLVAFVTGLALGAWFHYRARRRWPDVHFQLRVEPRQQPEVIGAAVAALGVADILASLFSSHEAGWARLASWLPLVGTHWPRGLMLFAGLGLVVVARGCARAQRAAWWIATVLMAISVVLHHVTGTSGVEELVAIGLLILLWRWRGRFTARAMSSSRRRGLKVLVGTLIVVPLYGMAGFYVFRGHFQPQPGVLAALQEAVARMAFSGVREIQAATPRAGWFLASIPLVTWMGMIYAGWNILRVVRISSATVAERDRAREIVERHGMNSASYMTLREGNSLFFNPMAEAYVAYRVGAGVAVTLGDPVGPGQHMTRSIEAFADFAWRNGWDHVFFATSAATFPTFVRLGYEPLKIGEEAVVDLPDLEFRGKEWQSMRTAINRARREDVRFQMFQGDEIPDDIRTQLFAISDEWLGERDLPEMEFTLGRTRDVDDPHINVAVAVSGSGRVHAFADWLPVYATGGWVIDLMRRRPDAMKGVMEFVIGESCVYFKERGYAYASLATAPLADFERDDDASLAQRLLGVVYERFDMVYNFRSLFQFKEKFQPRWEPVYLMRWGAANPVRVARALLHAHLPRLDFATTVRVVGSSLAHRLASREDEAS